MKKTMNSLSEQDFNNWMCDKMTIRLLEYVKAHLVDVKNTMVNSQVIMPNEGNGHHNLIRLLGMIDGLEIINDIRASDLLTEEELSENGNEETT